MTVHQTGKRDTETDLLVIGAGAAGMTAALVGALEGLEVILCEKSDMVGGTTATSAGTVWIPGSSQAADGTWRISGRALERLVEDRDLVANPPADNPYALPQSDGRSRRLPRG